MRQQQGICGASDYRLQGKAPAKAAATAAAAPAKAEALEPYQTPGLPFNAFSDYVAKWPAMEPPPAKALAVGAAAIAKAVAARKSNKIQPPPKAWAAS